MVFNYFLLAILFYHTFLFFFLTLYLYFLIPTVITQIFNPTAELAIPIGIPSKETKADTETKSVSAENNCN